MVWRVLGDCKAVVLMVVCMLCMYIYMLVECRKTPDMSQVTRFKGKMIRFKRDCAMQRLRIWGALLLVTPFLFVGGAEPHFLYQRHMLSLLLVMAIYLENFREERFGRKIADSYFL